MKVLEIVTANGTVRSVTGEKVYLMELGTSPCVKFADDSPAVCSREDLALMSVTHFSPLHANVVWMTAFLSMR